MSRNAFVLRLQDVGEADRIATLLFPDGRDDLRLPQARKSRRRFAGVQTLVSVEVDGEQRADRFVVTAAGPAPGGPGVPRDPISFALACHAAELLVEATPAGPHDDERFRLFDAAMRSLDPSPRSARGWARAFELKLLAVLGVRPALRRCAACGEPWDGDRPMMFAAALGGVTHPECAGTEVGRQALAPADLRSALESMHRPLREQEAAEWTDDGARRVEAALLPFLTLHIGRPGRARRVLDDLLRSLTATALTLAVGCAPVVDDGVAIQGYLFDGSQPELDGPTISGAAIRAVGDDGRTLAEGAEPYDDAPGFYRIGGLPPDTSLHLVVTGPEQADGVTVLSGRSSAGDLWVDAGVLHHPTKLDRDLWRLAWSAVAEEGGAPPVPDPAIDGQGGWIRGALHEPADPPLRLLFEDGEGRVVAATALDEAGLPSLDGRPITSGFELWGVHPGPQRILLLDADGLPSRAVGATWVEEDGLTSLPSLSVPDDR